MSPLQKRLSLLLSVLSLLALIAAVLVYYGWRQMRASLPQLDGEHALAGLATPVRIERDALGTPTITGATRTDVARATGFIHAQDRFFQMDLLRRRGAGELAELFGSAAIELDKSARLHDFRRISGQVLEKLSAPERELLQAYTAGVNAGLAALARSPWEYLVLRTPPRPWREEDSLLCVYAMWFDLQDSAGSFELNRDAVRNSLGQGTLDFLAPRGNSWDAAFDESKFPPPALPALRFSRPEGEKAGAWYPPAPAAGAEPTTRLVHGSNAFAVAGRYTANGTPLLANDMHLGLSVPRIWYRSVLQWGESHGSHRVVGVMLPGMPLVVAGSNGLVAWGFTDAYVDTSDVILAESDGFADTKYRMAQGWGEIHDRTEEIKVRGEKEPVTFVTRWTGWGPIIGELAASRYPVLRWSAHDPEATNLKLMEMETATTTAAAISIAHRAGLPNQNMLIADSDGHIAWTIAGLIPRRVGYDGRLPISWAFGDRRWDGWLQPDEIPVILDPSEGLLWSGNNRVFGGKNYALLGDSGYDNGARAGQIRDDLRGLTTSGKKTHPADLLAVQLDDRALFLERWQKFLLEILNEDALKQKPNRAKLRDVVQKWNGRASVDSAAYRIVKDFRSHVTQRAFAPFAENAAGKYASFSYGAFPYEDALWQLVHEQPARLLNPEHTSWNSLLLAAVDDVLDAANDAGVSPANFTWGRRNTLAMQHPFSRFLPAVVARLIDMPADQLPGDSEMPRVQGRSFGQSERLVVAPGHEDEGILAMPGGQSAHPLSPYFRAGHDAWVKGDATPLLPGRAQHTLVLKP